MVRIEDAWMEPACPVRRTHCASRDAYIAFPLNLVWRDWLAAKRQRRLHMLRCAQDVFQLTRRNSVGVIAPRSARVLESLNSEARHDNGG
jgi:hypothetical protein